MRAALLAFLSIALAAEASASTPPTPAALLADFERVAACTDRLWPGLTWEHLTVAALRPGAERVTGVHLGSRERFALKKPELPDPAAAESLYSFAGVGEELWLTMLLTPNLKTDGPHYLFGVGAHEAFHRLGQDDWAHPPGTRGTEVPIRWEPRYYRAEAWRNLLAAFLHPESSETSLRYARYWIDRWRAEFPAEYDARTDGNEGSADYVEKLAVAFTDLGCDVTEAKLRTTIAARLAKVKIDPKRFLALEHEGYQLGSVAAFLLRWDYPEAGWQERFAKGESALDILLAHFEPLPDPVVSPTREGYEKFAATQNERIEAEIGPELSALRAADAVWVALPLYEGRSFQFDNFFLVEGGKARLSLLGEALTYGPHGELQSKPGLSFTTRERMSLPCENTGAPTVVRRSEIHERDGLYEFNGAHLRGKSGGHFATAEDGATWFCPEFK